MCNFVGEQRRDAVKKAERNGESGRDLPFTLIDAINDKERAYNLAKKTLERSEYKSNSDFIGKFKTGNCKCKKSSTKVDCPPKAIDLTLGLLLL